MIWLQSTSFSKFSFSSIFLSCAIVCNFWNLVLDVRQWLVLLYYSGFNRSNALRRMRPFVPVRFMNSAMRHVLSSFLRIWLPALVSTNPESFRWRLPDGHSSLECWWRRFRYSVVGRVVTMEWGESSQFERKLWITSWNRTCSLAYFWFLVSFIPRSI